MTEYMHKVLIGRSVYISSSKLPSFASTITLLVNRPAMMVHSIGLPGFQTRLFQIFFNVYVSTFLITVIITVQ